MGMEFTSWNAVFLRRAANAAAGTVGIVGGLRSGVNERDELRHVSWSPGPASSQTNRYLGLT